MMKEVHMHTLTVNNGQLCLSASCMHVATLSIMYIHVLVVQVSYNDSVTGAKFAQL